MSFINSIRSIIAQAIAPKTVITEPTAQDRREENECHNNRVQARVSQYVGEVGQRAVDDASLDAWSLHSEEVSYSAFLDVALVALHATRHTPLRDTKHGSNCLQ